MRSNGKATGSSIRAKPAKREAWLLGLPPLSSYLNYTKRYGIGGDIADRSPVVDEWRRANDYYYDLEKSEAGIADKIQIAKLDSRLRTLVAEIEDSAAYKRTFDSLPARFAMVELDRLVVSQPHVDLDHSERLQRAIAPSMTPEALFQFCLPMGVQEPAIEARRAGSGRYLFWSQSSDLRFHEATLLKPSQLTSYDAYGTLAGALGLMVGFGSNFFSVIQSDNRLLVHNGHHRAHALRSKGITHAPCIIQSVTRRDELNLIAGSEVIENPAYYFKSDRPPLLKDFFDPKICKVLNVAKTVRVVEVKFEVKDFEMHTFEAEGSCGED